MPAKRKNASATVSRCGTARGSAVRPRKLSCLVPAACAGKEVSLKLTAERTGYITRETTSDAVKIGYGTITSSMRMVGLDDRSSRPGRT